MKIFMRSRMKSLYIRDYKVIFSQVAKQASNVSARKFRLRNSKPFKANIELLRFAKEQKKYIPYFEDHKERLKNLHLMQQKSNVETRKRV